MEWPEDQFHIEQICKELRLEWQQSRMKDDRFFKAVEFRIRDRAKSEGWSLSRQVGLADAVYSAIRGYDVLDDLLADPEVTEIMVNAYDRIFIEKKGLLYSTPVRFRSPEAYEDIIRRIVSRAGREVSRRRPITDCRMEDGSRVNVVLPPVAARAPVLTIRKFSVRRFSLDDLVDNGTMTREAADFLRSAIRARMNIFISGGTGSGKTSLLNALAGEISPEERLISIEDARELDFFGHDNWIALEARRGNAEGEGQISIRDLIRASLRMRPDRIIVGEVRGPEAIDMLQAMNTGHDGSISTGHANSIIEMQLRLETMIMSGDGGLPISAIRRQIGRAIDLAIHIARMGDGSRKLTEIADLSIEGDQVIHHTIFRREEGDLRFIEAPLRWDKFERAVLLLPEKGGTDG